MPLLSKLERLLGRFAIPNLSLYLIIGQVFFWGLAMMTGFNVERIALLPAAVLAGEGWRVVTFLFFPPTLGTDVLSLVFMAFGWYMFYLMGSALEHYWGDFRYNAFVGIGWFLTVAAAFAAPGSYASYSFLAGSVFLAFACLNPDFELLFFAGDILNQIRTGRRRMTHQARVFAASSDGREPRHRCRVCGKTELSDPRADFRYCSKCAGNQCYCADHIFNHQHVLLDEEPKRPS